MQTALNGEGVLGRQKEVVRSYGDQRGGDQPRTQSAGNRAQDNGNEKQFQRRMAAEPGA